MSLIHFGVVFRKDICMKCIIELKKRVKENEIVEIQQENGFIANVVFSWNPKANPDEIQELERALGLSLPKEYKDFLEICNGAILFEDAKYGQFGYYFLSINEIREIINSTIYVDLNIPKDCIIFAKEIGGSDLLIYDLQKQQDEDYYIVDGEFGYKYNEWDVITLPFSRFIDRLIVSQGSKFWRWK